MSSNKLLWLVWLPVPFRADIPKLNFNFTVMLPEIAFTGKYSLKMRLLLLNIQGRGDVNGTLGKMRKLRTQMEIILIQYALFVSSLH